MLLSSHDQSLKEILAKYSRKQRRQLRLCDSEDAE